MAEPEMMELRPTEIEPGVSPKSAPPDGGSVGAPGPERIMVAPSTTGQFLVGPDGEPVWPIANPHELEQLLALMSVFGATPRLADRWVERRWTGAGTVVSIGDGTAADGALYAHLTGREHFHAAALGEMLASGTPEVVVARPEHLSIDLFDLLYDDPVSSCAPGIITAASPAQLRSLILSRSAARWLRTPARTRRIDLMPAWSGESTAAAGHLALNGDDTPEARRAVLSAEAGVLTIATHSDGVAGFLGSRLTLCPMFDPPASAQAARSPRCIQTGVCSRTWDTLTGFRRGRFLPSADLPSVDSALRSGELVSPNAFRARILLWQVCSGLLDPRGAIDPRWGSGLQFAHSRTLGAVATTWKVEVTHLPSLLELASTIARGVPLGVALAQYNRCSPVRDHGGCLALLGDPRIALPPQDATVPAAETAPPYAVRAPEVRASGEAAFAAAYLTILLPTLEGALREPGQKALAELDRWSQAGFRATDRERDGGEPTRRALLEFLFRHGSALSDYWMRFARIQAQPPRRDICPGCDLRASTIIAQPALPGVSARRLTLCPRCSVAEDVPVSWNMRLSFPRPGTIALSGDLPRTNWTGGVLLDPVLPADRRAILWSAGADGGPVAEWSITGGWPPGPVYVAVILLSGTEIGILGRRVQRPAG